MNAIAEVWRDNRVIGTVPVPDGWYWADYRTFPLMEPMPTVAKIMERPDISPHDLTLRDRLVHVSVHAVHLPIRERAVNENRWHVLDAEGCPDETLARIRGYKART